MKKKMKNKKNKKWKLIFNYDEIITIRSIMMSWSTHLEYVKIPDWKEAGMSEKEIEHLIKEKEEAEKMIDLLFDKFVEAEPVGE